MNHLLDIAKQIIEEIRDKAIGTSREIAPDIAIIEV